MNKYTIIKSLGWYYLLALVLAGVMIYANATGWRVFSSTSQQTWGASGPGYHK